MTWRSGVKTGWCVVVVAGLVGCASSPPQPREDTRPLQPGAELAEEVGKTTQALIEASGQDRIRYASSLDPETDDTPALAEPPVEEEQVVDPEGDAPADTSEAASKEEADGDGREEDAAAEDAAPEDEASAPEAADTP